MSKPEKLKKPKKAKSRNKSKSPKSEANSDFGSFFDTTDAIGDMAEIAVDILDAGIDLPAKTVKPLTPDFKGAGGDFGGGGADASFETPPPAVIDTAHASLLDSVTGNFAAAADGLSDTASSALEVAGDLASGAADVAGNLASGAADVAGGIASGVGEVLGSLDL